jgi:peptidyl-prolyl cis-trans isomerase SurA
MSKKIIKSIFLIILLFFTKILSAEINIVLTIDDEIITNYDLEKESNYLKILNPKLNQLENNQILKLARNSLINEIIKKKEISKYIDLNSENLLIDKYINDLYKKLNIEDDDSFQIFLKKNNSFSILEVREKIKLEIFWNELIYSRHINKLKIDKEAIVKKVNSLDDDKIKEYLLSEIVFVVNKDLSTKDAIDLIQLSIKEIGFNNTANIYSISNSAKLGGKLGWVNENSLSKKVVEKLQLIGEGKNTDIIKIGNNYLILNLEKIKITEIKIDKNKEIEKLIQIETNKQLNQFSNIYFNKAKINYSINEN